MDLYTLWRIVLVYNRFAAKIYQFRRLRNVIDTLHSVPN